ncbi:hypothetical protein GCM10011594_29720 [Nakamurella endophytica]|uniref:Uncharacterized protein n=1 Tax=Nakamurella endophytica TaxID=1748367 RepID=A0A917T1U2_9ACTN|nr:hypothetical protein GCM10011594_29720 [Nakamurella endophytica]
MSDDSCSATARAIRTPRRVIFIERPTSTTVRAAATCARLRGTPSKVPGVAAGTAPSESPVVIGVAAVKQSASEGAGATVATVATAGDDTAVAVGSAAAAADAASDSPIAATAPTMIIDRTPAGHRRRGGSPGLDTDRRVTPDFIPTRGPDLLDRQRDEPRRGHFQADRHRGVYGSVMLRTRHSTRTMRVFA